MCYICIRSKFYEDKNNPTCVWEFSASLSSAPDESNMVGRIRRRFGVFPIWHGVLQVPFLCFGEEPVQEPTSPSSSLKILSLCESRGELIFSRFTWQRQLFLRGKNSALKGMRGKRGCAGIPISHRNPLQNPVIGTCAWKPKS